MLDNYDKFKFAGSSNLPRVRTYLREYLVTENLTLPYLQLSHVGQFGRYGDQFEVRPVLLGRSDGQYVEVLKGLQAGVKYAARNSFLIKADIGKSGASHDH